MRIPRRFKRVEPWLTWVAAALSVIVGSGGLVAWYKARQDSKLGLKKAELEEDTYLAEQWRSLIETQSKALIDPLTNRVAALTAEMTVLQEKVSALEKERKDWTIREGLLWDWADMLVLHIDRELPPPAPERPEGLRRTR